MTESESGIFYVGDWRIDPGLGQITRGHTTNKVEPKVMELLVFLCARPGEVISGDEIVNAVWGGRPMGDNPIYKSVAKLRRAMDDDPNNPKYIGTIPKKGYRLLVKVDREPIAAVESLEHQPRRALPWLIGMVVGGLIATLLLWRPVKPPPNLTSFSNFPGSHLQPSLAPSGGRFVFVNNINRSREIWISDPLKQGPRALTDGPNDSRPRWSPTDDVIVFSRNNSIWSTNAQGDNAKEIIRSGYNPNFSHDGRKIVFERRYEIWTADANGSNQARVQGVPKRELPLSPRWPAFSPDGRQIAYFDSSHTPMGDLWIIDSAGGTPSQLTFAAAFGGAPVWSSDGQHIIYSSQRNGSRTLWRVDVETKSSDALLIGSGNDDFPDISADGKTLMYSNDRHRFAIVQTTPSTGRHKLLHESRQTLLGPELSPNGERLAFFGSARAGGIQLFSLNIKNNTIETETSDPLSSHAIPRWSRDGQTLYYYHAGENTSYRKVDLKARDTAIVSPDWNWNTANGADVDTVRKRIVYSRLTGQVPVQTLIRDIANGEDTTFHATLEYPRWSEDGESVIGSLFTSESFPGDVAICDTTKPNCQMLAEKARIPMWSTDETMVYFVRGFGRTQEVFRVPREGGREEKIMTMEPLFQLGPFYDVTADGDIIWVRYEKEPSELWSMDL
ncbi:MAG: winged helix-turn-helix domain-containing protein [Pseudomonadota bacterium]